METELNPMRRIWSSAPTGYLNSTAVFQRRNPDGGRGDVMRFLLLPKKGSVQAETDGSFVYTPEKTNKREWNSFSYIAIDLNGNISIKATVTISINKQSTKITYSSIGG
jgi:hypothetical protein